MKSVNSYDYDFQTLFMTDPFLAPFCPWERIVLNCFSELDLTVGREPVLRPLWLDNQLGHRRTRSETI